MTKEVIDTSIEFSEEMTIKYYKMTKKELVNRICALTIENKVQQTKNLRIDIAIEDANKAFKEIEDLKFKLNKAESYVEQGRAMIESIMEKWYHYDD